MLPATLNEARRHRQDDVEISSEGSDYKTVVLFSQRASSSETSFFQFVKGLAEAVSGVQQSGSTTPRAPRWAARHQQTHRIPVAPPCTIRSSRRSTAPVNGCPPQREDWCLPPHRLRGHREGFGTLQNLPSRQKRRRTQTWDFHRQRLPTFPAARTHPDKWDRQRCRHRSALSPEISRIHAQCVRHRP